MNFIQSMTQKPMRPFLLIWIGQVFSMLGSSTTAFATTLWVWERTNQATPLAMIGVFFMVPSVILTPFAGVLVDRFNRKLVMAVSDMAAGLGTLFMLVMLATNQLQIWHLYLMAVLTGAGNAFQFPAYSAAITLMVPKEEYARTAGMISIAENSSSILAPLLGAILYTRVGLFWVLIIDLVTMSFALLMLALVRIPSLSDEAVQANRKEPFLSQLSYGLRYVLRFKPLLNLQLLFLVGNFFSILGNTMVPMIMVKTGNNAGILANVQSASAAGALIGSILITITGGLKKKVNGVLGGWFLYALFGMTLFSLASSSLLWMAFAILGHMCIMFVNSSNQAIWQSKVPAEVQGRVFSFRVLLAQVSVPVAMAISGPLADKVFEPALVTEKGGYLSRLLPEWLGLGAAGNGYAMLMTLAGAVILIATAVAWLNPQVRKVEELLPDAS